MWSTTLPCHELNADRMHKLLQVLIPPHPPYFFFLLSSPTCPSNKSLHVNIEFLEGGSVKERSAWGKLYSSSEGFFAVMPQGLGDIGPLSLPAPTASLPLCCSQTSGKAPSSAFFESEELWPFCWELGAAFTEMFLGCL